MKYIAEITNKDIFDGVLVIQVRFTSEDGTKIVQDSFSTKSGQDPDWIKNAIKRKMKDLEGVEDLKSSIPVGVVDVETVVEAPTNTAKQRYAKDLEDFNKMVSVLRKGFIEADNAAFVALQTKLKNNFQPEYLDLF
jgi:hypothetical protein